MFRSMSAACLAVSALCLAAATVAPSPVCAGTSQYAAAGPYVPEAAIDSMLVVVELRSVAAIEYDRDVAVQRRSAAETREATARVYQSRASTTIRIKESDISALKARIDQAKSERNEALKQELERARDVAEVEKKLLERREQLRRSDIEFAKSQVEYHAAEMEAYGLELELARLRSRRVDVQRNSPTPEQRETAWQLDEQIREMEGRTLDAFQEGADKGKDLSERATDLYKSRKKVWEAQRALISSVGRPK